MRTKSEPGKQSFQRTIPGSSSENLNQLEALLLFLVVVFLHERHIPTEQPDIASEKVTCKPFKPDSVVHRTSLPQTSFQVQTISDH